MMAIWLSIFYAFFDFYFKDLNVAKISKQFLYCSDHSYELVLNEFLFLGVYFFSFARFIFVLHMGLDRTSTVSVPVTISICSRNWCFGIIY